MSITCSHGEKRPMNYCEWDSKTHTYCLKIGYFFNIMYGKIVKKNPFEIKKQLSHLVKLANGQAQK